MKLSNLIERPRRVNGSKWDLVKNLNIEGLNIRDIEDKVARMRSIGGVTVRAIINAINERYTKW